MLLEMSPQALIIGGFMFYQSRFQFYAKPRQGRTKRDMQYFTRMKIIQQ